MDHRTIWAARLVVLVAFLDLFIQFPVVAPYAQSLGASAFLVGIIVAAYSASNLVGNLIAGIILDRWGRKRPIVLGLVLTAAAVIGYLIARTPEQLLVFRLFHGLAGSVLTPGAFTLIGDTARPEQRARVMGVTGTIIALAAVVGPAVSGIARDRIGIGAVFIGSACLLLVAAAIFARFARVLPVTARVRRAEPFARQYLALWSNGRLVSAYVAALALTFSLGTLVTYLPLTLVAHGGSAARTGFAFTIFAAVAMVGMAGPLSRLGDRYGRILPVSGGLIILGMAMLSLGLSFSPSTMALGMAIFGLGFGLLFPSAAALVTDATAQDERGAAFGIFYGVYSFGVVVGSVASGALGEVFGVQAGAPFIAGGTIALMAAPVLFVRGRRLARPAPVLSSSHQG